jgi:probable HAF family extracellular repeat protein
MTDLGTLPGAIRSSATAINNAGQIVGSAWSVAGPGHAFHYSGGKMTDLGTFGGSFSSALAINASGQVVGMAATKDESPHAFLYSGGKMIDLGPPGSSSSAANGINNAGQVVGDYYTKSGSPRAFLYSGGKLVDLNTLIPPEDHWSAWTLLSAAAINNKGQIVGYGTTASGATHAFLLTPTAEAPEPGTLALGALGALGLMGYAWRRRARGRLGSP